MPVQVIARGTGPSIIETLSAPDAKAPLSVKLRCKSWAQVKHLYDRDIQKGALFLKASKPPPLGTVFQISLGLPSDSSVQLVGKVTEHIPPGGLKGLGPGVMLRLDQLPYTAKWLIESALSAAAKSGSLETKTAEQEPGVSSGKEISKAEVDLIESLRLELLALRELNPFQLLEIEYTANDEEVRGAFGLLTRRYHPDRFAKYQSDGVRQLGAEIYLLIRDAYQTLQTEAGRNRTAAMLNDLRGAEAANRDFVAQQHSRVAVKTTRVVRRGPSKSAAPAKPAPKPPPAPRPPPAPARPAAKPPVPSAKRASPGATAASSAPSPAASAAASERFAKLVGAKKYEEALMLAKLTAKKAPDDRRSRANVELCGGLIAMERSDRLEAAQHFEAALELDPRNEHAIRGLAQLRRKATEERKGFLGSLLKKKKD